MNKFLYKVGNAVDDLKSVISPQSAMKSKAARDAYFGYDAAKVTRRNPHMPTNAKSEVYGRRSRDRVMARARDLERNSPVACSLIFAVVNNVVRGGFNFQAITENDRFNERIESLWKEWEHHENCDYTGQQSLDDIIKMIVRRQLVDGGALITFPIDTHRDIPMTIQVHEADELTDDGVINLQNGNILLNGVELTKKGVPVAYWLKQVSPDGLEEYGPIRGDARDCICLWERNRPSQYRGLSPMAPVIDLIDDLTDYNSAVTVQQKTAAYTSAFIETENLYNAPGRIANTPKGERVERLKPGTVVALNPGEHVKPFIPSGQANEAGEFIPIMQRMIAAAFGLSLESTSRNVERVNYSSARQNLLADEVTYRNVRGWLEEYFLRPLYKRFVNICYLKGLLDGTGFKPNDPSYYKCEWLASTMGWIDPLKEANANTINLANGGKSFQQYCSEQGVDWKDRILEMAEVQKFAEENGVKLSYITEQQDTNDDWDYNGENENGKTGS